MLKENWRFIARVQRIADLLIVILAFFTAYYGRSSLYYWNNYFEWGLPFEGSKLLPVKDYSLILIIAGVSYLTTLNIFGAYTSMRMATSWQLLRLFAACSAVVFVILAAALFILKVDVSRSFIGLFCILMTLFLAVERYLVLAILRFWRKRGFNFRNIIICGTGDQAVRLAREIYARPELGIRVRCFADLRSAADPAELQQFKDTLKQSGNIPLGRIVTGLENVAETLKSNPIDEVIFTDIVRVMPEVEALIYICLEQGVRTTLAADLFSTGIVKSGISHFGSMPLIHFQTPPGDRWELGVKRGVDFIVAAVLLICLAPIMILIALMIKLTSKGPVFYVQRRRGLNGRLFDLYKFRSMHVGAEHQLEKLKAQNEMTGPAFKLTEDPRITPVGRFLRRFSLDELPQLWNVIKGDMSLVGPRPPVPDEVAVYERFYRRRLSMRPGLTCTWQVSGRNNISDFESWVKLDLDYIDNWSLTRDFVLLLRTIPAVILGRGAR